MLLSGWFIDLRMMYFSRRDAVFRYHAFHYYRCNYIHSIYPTIFICLVAGLATATEPLGLFQRFA